MILNRHACRALIGAAAGALGLGLASAALAQAGYDETGPVEGVTVTPFRKGHSAHDHSAHDGRAGIGGPIEEQPVSVNTSRFVGFSDLDLRSRRDAYMLRVRIERAAHSACDDLAAQPGAEDQDSAYCYADAVDDGLRQAVWKVGFRPAGW
ncbi:MAG: UrcA family protein [Proteobacteria bacterium]|nr:UrcA family protein [Pseudomonadota bacterium]